MSKEGPKKAAWSVVSFLIWMVIGATVFYALFSPK
jgi:hypothetical protein